MLALDDPTSPETPFAALMDTIFLSFYTVEMALKILAFGFVFNKNSYLRDSWNILDFTIIFTAYLPLLLSSDTINLTALRSLRVLRPLRALSSIKALKEILEALFAAVPPLQSVMVILIFFYTIFSIAGLQLFSGVMKKRCVSLDSGMQGKLIG